MDLILLGIATLLGLLGVCNAQEDGNDCLKASASSCGACLQVSPKCGWCKDITYLKQNESPSARCDELGSLVEKGCNASQIEDPRGDYKILKNIPVSHARVSSHDTLSVPPEITQIQPQKVSLNLRSGEPQTFFLKFKRVNYPSSEIILRERRMPREGLSITYKSFCKNGVVGTGENGNKCSDISIGDEVSFEISVESQKCVSKGPLTIKIKPQGKGFTDKVEIVLNFICECECHKDAQPNSEICSNGNGTFECGVCRCDEGRIGQDCECSMYEVDAEDMDRNCRRDNGPDICSNNGDCVCGSCECKGRENPEERYSGKYCECDNFNCDHANNKLCGGHGWCECRQCICDANYTGSACDCSLHTSDCLASNQQICNGRGVCECGRCKCTDPKYQGPTCETCPTCPGLCEQTRPCVQCLAFGTGENKDTCERDCKHLNLIKVPHRDKLPQPGEQTYDELPEPDRLVHCKQRDGNDCWFYYTYAVRESKKEIHVVEKLDCPANPSLGWGWW